MTERKRRRQFLADEGVGEIGLQCAVKPTLIQDGPDRFVDTAKSGYIELKSLIKKWRRRTLYAVTPFVPAMGAPQAIATEQSAKLVSADSELRSRALAETAPVMIWTSGSDKLCNWFNQSWLTFVGRSMEQEVGNGWVENVHGDDLSLCFERYLHVFDARLPFTRSYRLKRHDGQYRWVLDKAIPLFDSTGHFTGYMGCCMDISDQKRVEESLREADRLKDEFVANMSHEIRSPMTSMLAHADILLAHLKDPNDIDSVKTIKQGGNHLLELIGDILDLSKLEAGKLKIRREKVSLLTVLNEVHALMAVRAKEKGLPLILSYDGVIPEFLETDRTRVRQILLNLVGNAIKFTTQGSVQIVARFDGRESRLELEVKDTGIGIPEEQRERLFQPFAQAEETVARADEGTGLGLAITKRLLDLMGGEISFESIPNQGSVFRVRVPCVPASTGVAVQPRKESVPAAFAASSSIHCRVLVADDREEIRYLLKVFLERAGGRVIAVGDGPAVIAAVEKAKAEGTPIDIAILDVQMPGLDGYQTTKRLRAGGFTNPIIGLTAGGMGGDREKCLRAGFDAYLRKPIDQPTLLEVVRRYAQ